MANTKAGLQDYIRFVLSDSTGQSIVVKNIIGWNEVGLDAMRNMEYHGVITQVSNELSFNNEEKDIIENEYTRNSILGKINLIVYRLEDKEGEVQWVEKYFLFADFATRKIKDDVLSITFNSNTLMDLLDAYEDEEFEVERLETVDNKIIKPLDEMFLKINGRSLNAVGTGKFIPSTTPLTFAQGILNEVITEGPSRHSSSTQGLLSGGYLTGDYMFYGFSLSEEPLKDITINFNISKAILFADSSFLVVRYDYDEDTARYTEVESDIIFTGTHPTRNSEVSFTGSRVYKNVGFRQSLRFYMATTIQVNQPIENIIGSYTIEESSFFEPSPSIKFNFFHDVLNRLMLIITGRDDSFYSEILGRVGTKDYKKDGDYGLIGFLSGLWVRNFKKDAIRYKSPILSIKNGLQSICNVFNLGSGIENIGNNQRLIVEDIRYFYRDDIIGSFQSQISKVERNTEARSFYSGLEFGYEKVQKLDQEMGLDEPNIKSNFITPIYNTKNKFNKLSKIRADEYKLETLRRKPILTNGDDSLSGDEDNWFLDLKRLENDIYEYGQVHWSDRLEKSPTGIHDPESFTSMIFTPMRILIRMASIFNSGVYLFKEKFINFTSSSSNRDLSMQFKEEEDIKESQNIKVSDLKRPIFKNEIIKFTHPYTAEVENLIFGKTKVGDREIPNFYFKMEWVNEKGDIERGYFLKYEYSDNPTFEFLLANEDII